MTNKDEGKIVLRVGEMTVYQRNQDEFEICESCMADIEAEFKRYFFMPVIRYYCHEQQAFIEITREGNYNVLEPMDQVMAEFLLKEMNQADMKKMQKSNSH